MAPSRGKGKAPARRTAILSPRGTRNTTRSQVASDVPDVYRSLLDEATERDARDHAARPLKRRKVAGRTKTPEPPSSARSGTVANRTTVSAASNTSQDVVYSVQTIEESSEDEASDLEFEDVDLNEPTQPEPDPIDGIEDLSISIQAECSGSKEVPRTRRKPATYAEKAHRLIVHKLHILCLLGHCMYVNGRCNNVVVQKHLRSLLTTKTISYLNPDAVETQFQRNRSFMDGLQQALQAFTTEYRTTTGGMTKPQWEVEGDTPRKHDLPPPLDRADFIAAAKDLEGSQDTGNQLFCALLRAAGVEARMVCSLQVLPYTSMPKQSTPRKPAKTRVFAIAADTPRAHISAEDAAVRGSEGIGNVPAVRRRLGQPTFAAESGKVPPLRNKAKPVPKLTFPVFWVEAFNEAQQKWIAIDPLVTRTINKPSQLEPPASYELNRMNYAIAFEAAGTARDVTKRYAKAYNAKTRRHRVEASADGGKWFKKAIRIFRRRGGALDRDQVEDSELAQKEAKEGMPGNVQDFKDHPYYALERHLKRHEVIHPRREVGKVNAGTAAKPRMEPVYRAQDVFICKSADKWYRLGREIKEGEQPLKHVPAQSRRQRSVEDDDKDESTAWTGLYASHQTQPYVPPPVQRGRIPKNIYGNLDIYVPSMVPAGAVHVRHDMAQRAARLLRIDYADAVTGFKFQGRHGTAIIDGVVVALQHEDAVRTVIEGLDDEMMMEESKARSLVALHLWKRFMTGLKIAERVSAYADGSAKEADITEDMPGGDSSYTESFGQDDNPLRTAGQFSVYELSTPSKLTRQKKRRKVDDSDSEYEAEDGEPPDEAENDHSQELGLSGGFILDGGEGGFLPSPHGDGGFFADNAANEGGGFVPHDDAGGFILGHENEGGFMHEDTPTAHDDLFGEVHKSRAAPTPTPADCSRGPADEDTTMRSPHSAEVIDDTLYQKHRIREFQDEKAVQDASEPSQSPHGEDDSDKASILSHDPEDDDAEPDWLESD